MILTILNKIMKQLPFWLLGLPPVVEAKHDREGAGGQQLLVVIVVQAVGRSQGKSVTNLWNSIISSRQDQTRIISNKLISIRSYSISSDDQKIN